MQMLCFAEPFCRRRQNTMSGVRSKKPVPPFQLMPQEQCCKQLTIALRGEIDHHSAKDIMRVVGNKIELYLPRVCVLDFREVTFMDSSGIAIVIACVRHMRQLRGEVILRSVPPQPMKVLRASGIERIATLEDERSLVHES